MRGKRWPRGPRRYLPGGWSATTAPVHFFLIEHPAGICLFDTGQAAAAARPGYLPRWHPFLRLARFELGPDDEAAAQLARIGLTPGMIRWVVLSHLHTDHVGGLEPFADAEVLASRTEWRRARGWPGRLRGYLPQHWPATLRPTLVDFDDGPVGPFASSRRLTDDGRLALVPTPGHTPGHMALLVQGERAGYLLGGDMAHSTEELDSIRPEVAAFCREQGIAFLATHDPRAALLASQPGALAERAG